MVTINDVAVECGVSVATVSRVINKCGNVSAATTKLVEDVIEKLGYTPNMLGRHLRKMETKKILVLMPDISNMYYSRVINGIEDYIESDGYNIVLCNTGERIDKELNGIDLLKSKVVDGAIFLGPRIRSEELSKLAKNYPVVQCSEYIEDAQCSTVSIDNRKAACETTQYLISKAGNRVAFVGSNMSYISSYLRYKGYLDALKMNDIRENPDYVVFGSHTFKDGYDYADKLMKLENPPRAIFAISDTLAIGVVKKLLELGIKVGEEVFVFGFDNVSISSLYSPTISTVAQPRYAIGKEAARLLFDKMKNIQCENEMIKLNHKLVFRQSTGD